MDYKDDPRLCGGSLINSKYVLSAAHCMDPDPVTIILGTTDFRNYTISSKVSKTLAHPNFKLVSESEFELLYDIALIKMEDSVKFSQKIYPICLPFQIENYEPPNRNTKFLVSGWGITKHIFENYILTAVEIKFYDFELCKKIFSMNYDFLNSKVFCAGGELGVDTCLGDSGSPVMRKVGNIWVIDGIVASGLDNFCGTLNPAVYTNVSKYENWIVEHIFYGFGSGESSRFLSLTLLLLCCLLLFFSYNFFNFK